MKIHPSHSKKDLVKVINELKLDIDTTLTRFEIVRIFHKNNLLEEYNLHYLSDENKNKPLSIKEKNNVILKAKQINSLQKNGFNIQKSLFNDKNHVIDTAIYISNYGDISSVRRAVKFINEHYDINIICKLSKETKEHLSIKEDIKNNSVPSMIIKKGSFKVHFD
tara:strand:+ start:7697 stop:8191 length:495 start_codon:yes stop_codon:yes gene_type:complete